MSANRILLACSYHKTFEEMLCIAERADGDAQYTAASMKRADDWFAKHQRCGPGADHYQLAYQRPLDWDKPLPAPETAAAVRMALVSANGHDRGGES